MLSLTIKNKIAKEAGRAIEHLIELDLKPSDIMTEEAFENAITVVIALGGIYKCGATSFGNGRCELELICI
jgi:Dihydroxyacid dehydratase/phosphogluconate dehydratase